MRRINALLGVLFMLCASGAAAFALASASSAAAASGTVYTPGTPALDAVSGGPWNTSQGDPSAGESYSSADLFPTYTPGGAGTTLGGLEEPNLAVYPTGTEGATVPYPSGVAGTPGPLDGYCSSLGANPETGTPVPQPGRPLPMAPYYFPDVVRNADGSLTGYFDYRPKDAEEAVTVARSTDGGKSWTAEGTALGENSGYCPTADTNDDGQGHPYVTSVDGETDLYTLQRPAGDNTGIGMLVHHVDPAASNPLVGLPANEAVGVDPNTYAQEVVEVPTSGEGVRIPVSTLGSAGSPEQIVAGPYEDASAPSPSSQIVTCTGTSTEPAPALTGCTVAGERALAVRVNDDLLQVIAKVEAPVTVPVGPNKPSGEGGLESLKFVNGNATVSPITTYLMNVNAPNRVYIDGATVYCAQANANPTTKLENCTTTSATPLSVQAGDAITADPILPPDAQMTTGLLAPDGIVGTLPKYAGAPEGATVVLYTQKVLSYFIVGTTDGIVESSGKFKAGTIKLPASTINFKPSVTESEPLPASGTFKIYLGTEVGQPIQEVTCTGVSAATQAGVPPGSRNLTGCSGGLGSVKEGNWIGGPNAAIAPYSALEKIGEGTDGKSKGPEKLFGNNEDLSILRAAYTFNGVNFTDLGPISGTTSGTGNDSGEYNDLSNPDQQASPSSTSPTSLAAGEPDTTELRYIGSRGSIVTNPNGSYGLFLSGSWATDGDSDAFNQIFYSSSTNGKEWTVPKVVLSTDYTFSASAAQDRALAEGRDEPLGIGAYYSGRAYGPAVVQNPNGSLTMVFAGYRLPKPITSAGTKLGTNAAAQYTVGTQDPALYRDILTTNLTSATSPGVATSTGVSASDEGTGDVGAPVTYTATVAPVSPGTGTPTGTVSFADSHGPIAGCGSVQLSEGAPDTATCATTHELPRRRRRNHGDLRGRRQLRRLVGRHQRDRHRRTAGVRLARASDLQRPRSRHVPGARERHPGADDHQVGQPAGGRDVRERDAVGHADADRYLRGHLHREQRRGHPGHAAVHADGAGLARHQRLAAGGHARHALQRAAAGGRRRAAAEMVESLRDDAASDQTELQRRIGGDCDLQEIRARHVVHVHGEGHRLDAQSAPGRDGAGHVDDLLASHPNAAWPRAALGPSLPRSCRHRTSAVSWRCGYGGGNA